MGTRHTGGVALRISALSGVAAYLLGVLVVVGSSRFGLHPDAGLWHRATGLGEYLVVHTGAYLPIWGGTVQTAVLAQTAVLIALLVAAGYLAARRSDNAHEPVWTGSSIVLGYCAATVVGSVYVVVTVQAITWTEILAPTVLVGAVLPVVFGGLGGWLGVRLLETGSSQEPES